MGRKSMGRSRVSTVRQRLRQAVGDAERQLTLGRHLLGCRDLEGGLGLMVQPLLVAMERE